MNQRPLILQLSAENRRLSERQTAQASILVVDQNHVTRDTISRLLADNGYSVQTAESGDAALDRLSNSPPDLMLLTVNLPEQDWLNVLRTIRQQHSELQLPVMLVTADDEPQQGVRAFRAGASDFLARPFADEILLARVSLHLQHRRAYAELQHSRDHYAFATQGAQIGLWDLDIVRQKLFLSSHWKDLLGFAEDELDSTIPIWLDRMHPDDRNSFIEVISTSDSLNSARFDCELRMRHRNDSYRWMHCSGRMQFDADGNLVRLAGSLVDVTEGKVRDVLTGLPNRLLFEEQLSKVLHLNHDEYGLNAVLFLDLDDFKRINDNYGHDAGDLLLCTVARKLEGCLRGSDVIARQKSCWSIARHGGDEFTILLHQLASRADVEHIADRIIVALAEPLLLGTREVRIGVSIGIAFGGPESKTSADTIREADTAMYYAKASGRCRYCIFDREMQATATAKLDLENDLRQALHRDEFFLVYQPIVRLSSGRIEGFEALCRWRHPRQENIGPAIFLASIQSLGLTSRLGRAIFDQACEDAITWPELACGDPKLTVTVNCAAEAFTEPGFKNDLLLTMTRVGIDPHTLRLEVTEAALLGKPEQTRVVMNELRDLGIRIGIDDFGIGVSSLAFLHRLPLDLLKIDQSFVHKILNCSETRDIVRTIINLAQNLNLDVVAEGVETVAQRDLLYDMGCSHAQGYLYSQPVAGPEIAGLLASNQKSPSILRTRTNSNHEASRLETSLQDLDNLLRQH